MPVSVPAPAALLGAVPEVGLDAALVQRHRRRPHVVARVEPESYQNKFPKFPLIITVLQLATEMFTYTSVHEDL